MNEIPVKVKAAHHLLQAVPAPRLEAFFHQAEFQPDGFRDAENQAGDQKAPVGKIAVPETTGPGMELPGNLLNFLLGLL